MVSIAYGQLLNKDVIAEIFIEKESEFIKFKATALNKTNADLSLRYEYLLFIEGKDGAMEKSSQDNRFFIQSYEKKILNALTLSYSVDKKVILVLLLFDKDNKPIGKKRIVLEKGSKSDLTKIITESKNNVISFDEIAGSGGYVYEGLIIRKLLTKAGRDFSRYFYSEYYNKEIISPQDIFIKESPAGGTSRTTRISVRVGDQLVWQFFARPKKDFLIAQTETAINRVLLQLQRVREQRKELIRY